MEWDEPDEEYRASGPEEPAFAEESVQRELALVALEAAALSRRIFPPPLTRRALSEEARQALLALALVDPGEGLSPRTLGAVLALDAEDARQGIAELLALGMVKKHFVDDGVEPVDAEYSLTQRGRAAATEVALAAKRCLPGWPPPGRRA